MQATCDNCGRTTEVSTIAVQKRDDTTEEIAMCTSLCKDFWTGATGDEWRLLEYQDVEVRRLEQANIRHSCTLQKSLVLPILDFRSRTIKERCI